MGSIAGISQWPGSELFGGIHFFTLHQRQASVDFWQVDVLANIATTSQLIKFRFQALQEFPSLNF